MQQISWATGVWLNKRVGNVERIKQGFKNFDDREIGYKKGTYV